MKPEEIKSEFVENINLILNLSKTYRTQNYYDFVQDNHKLKYLSDDSLKSINYIIRALNKELHPDRQINARNPLTHDKSKELQAQLNNASAFIKKYGHLFINLDMKYEYNAQLFLEKNENGLFSDFIKTIFANGVNEEKKVDPYENIKDENLKKLLINWDLSHRSLKTLNNEDQYVAVYKEMLDDLTIYLLSNQRNDNNSNSKIKLLADKLNKFVKNDINDVRTNGLKVNVQKLVAERFNYLFLGQALYDFNERFSLNCNVFAKAYNNYIDNDKYKININYLDFKNKIVEEIIDGFVSNDKDIIKNVNKNGDKLVKYLDNYYFKNGSFVDIDNNVFKKISELNDKKLNQLMKFLINSNSLNFEQMTSYSLNHFRKSFIEKFILGDESWKLLSDEKQEHDFKSKSTLDRFQQISTLLFYHNNDKNTLSLQDLNTLTRYSKQIVLSEAIDFNNENVLIEQVMLALEKSNKYELSKKFESEIQEIRDNNFLISMAEICVDNPKLINSLSIFKSYAEQYPNPNKIKDELEKLGVEGLDVLTVFKNIQNDYRLKSMGLLHKNNWNHRVDDFSYRVNYAIYSHELRKIELDKQIEFCIKNENMVNVLDLIAKEHVQSGESQTELFFNSLKRILNNNENDIMNKNNKNALYTFLNRNQSIMERHDVNINNIEDLKYKNSILYHYINEKTHGGLDYKLNLLDDFKHFKKVKEKLHNEQNGSVLSKMFVGLNYFKQSIPSLSLFLAYEQKDLIVVEKSLSKIDRNSEINYCGMPFASYIAFHNLLNKENNNGRGFNDEVIKMMNKMGFNNALAQTTPLSKLKINDSYSAYQKEDVFDVLKERKVLESFNFNKTWKDKLLDSLVNQKTNELKIDKKEKDELDEEVNDLQNKNEKPIVYMSTRNKKHNN